MIETIDVVTMRKALKMVDRSKLTEHENFRNLRNKTLLYRYNPNSSKNAKSTLKDFEDFTVNVEVTECKLDAYYPFDITKVNFKLDGLKIGNFPSFYNAENVRSENKMVGHKVKNERVCLIIKQIVKPVRAPPKKGFVYYDYPHKKLGQVNSIVGPVKFQYLGNLYPKNYNFIQDKSQSKRTSDIYWKCLESLKNTLYWDQGIIFEMRDTGGFIYEIERPMGNFKLANNRIGYSFENTSMIYPDGLLSQTANPKPT